jgi:carbonic anhydrase
MQFPQRLIDGYRAFCESRLPAEQHRFRELAERGQSPEIMVIGCADSRVSPEVIFDARPGELFVIRNVANLVPPYSPDGTYHGVSAALEFAVQGLKVKHIVVLAHARCGGVQAFVEQAAPLSAGDFIGRWMSLMAPAVETVGPRTNFSTLAAYFTALEQVSAVKAIENLMSFPYVRARVERGALALHAAYFDVASGLLSVRDPATREFASVAGAGHARMFKQPRF